VIDPELIRQARGRTVILDADVLMAYIRASQKLAMDFGKEPYEIAVAETLEQWEIAHSTLIGNVRAA
jgi:hypothetical protein